MPTKASSTGSGYPSGMKNRIINGGMDISQRGTTFTSPATNAYLLDRYRWNNTTDGAVTITQNSDVPSNNEFQNSLRVAVTTADTSITASQFSAISQSIEGYNIRDLIGRTFTTSFWVRSTKTGTHCIALRNSIADRSYIAEYTVNSSNTWEYKTITVAGGLPTAGTWNYTTGRGLEIYFAIACGSTYQTTAGAWNTGNLIATSNQVNAMDTIGNIFAITGVQIEAGSTATPFEHRPYGAELALCYRYYEQYTVATGGSIGAIGYAYNTTTANLVVPIAPKCVSPITTYTGTLALIAGGSVINLTGINGTYHAGASGTVIQVAVASGLTAGGGCSLYANGTACTLCISAEF